MLQIVKNNGTNAALQAEVKTLTDHLEGIKQDLAAEKQKNHLLEQQLQLRGTGTPTTRGAGQFPSGSGVSEALAEKVATLEIKELNERQRADLASVRYCGSMPGTMCSGCLVFQGRNFHNFGDFDASDFTDLKKFLHHYTCINHCKTSCEYTCKYLGIITDLFRFRCKQLQETAHQLEYRNSSLEQKFSELTQKLLQSQAREVDFRDQLASSLPQGEKTSLENQIEELRKKEAELRLQNSQLQEVAEVARQQVVAIETKKKSHDLELSSLRHQLLDVQMQSDEKSLIGRLHHQIVALQVHAYRIYNC